MDTSKNKPVLVCDECGEEFEEYESKRPGDSNYCSRSCYSAGEPNIPYYGQNWKEQRKLVLEDGPTCCYTGCEKEECDNGRDLHVHHLTPMAEFDSPEDSNELSNLVPVCSEHHPILERSDDQEQLIS
jgi:hypothetical protein